MKKQIFILLFVLFLQRISGLDLEFDCKIDNYSKGDTLELSVNLSDSVKIRALNFHFGYSATTFECVKIENGLGTANFVEYISKFNNYYGKAQFVSGLNGKGFSSIINELVKIRFVLKTSSPEATETIKIISGFKSIIDSSNGGLDFSNTPFNVDLFTTLKVFKKSEDVEYRVYPNPFNPEVKIAVRSMELGVRSFASDLSIKIFNIKGILVEDLSKTANSLQLTPNSLFTWNATNQPAGIYIVKIKTDKKVYSERITLIK